MSPHRSASFKVRSCFTENSFNNLQGIYFKCKQLNINAFIHHQRASDNNHYTGKTQKVQAVGRAW